VHKSPIKSRKLATDKLGTGQVVGNSGKTWKTICAQEAAIVPCERALKCPQGAMK